MPDPAYMRRRALAGRAVLLFALAMTALAPGAAASAGVIPGSARSGGTPYGSALPHAARPMTARLRVTPRRVIAASTLPQISFRVLQRGVRKVKARITVLRVPRHRKLAGIALGWVRTGRAVNVPWPPGIVLRSGRYRVLLHASDRRGHTLRRSRRRPGRAVIVVGRPRAGAISPGGPGVFPVAGAFDFSGSGARFGAVRNDHVHQGQDIIAASGTPVLAPYAGSISATGYQSAGAGEYVVLDAVDGRDYFFAHCVRHSTAVGEGAAVVRGQRLCAVGATGDATGPHLHFEIWIVGWRVPGGYPIDPLPELRAWSGR